MLLLVNSTLAVLIPAFEAIGLGFVSTRVGYFVTYFIRVSFFSSCFVTYLAKASFDSSGAFCEINCYASDGLNLFVNFMALVAFLKSYSALTLASFVSFLTLTFVISIPIAATFSISSSGISS